MDQIIHKANNINVGIIGTGVMGEYHAKAYNNMHKMGMVNFVGIADIDEKRAKEVADKYGCKSYVNHIDLIESGIDAVSICVPTNMHKEIALDCITRHIHGILVEKPIADNLNDALEIVNGARRIEAKLLIGHVERFNPAILRMKEIIDSGKLGHVVSISAKRVGPLPPRVRNVGIIIDLAVHDIDVISYLYGKEETRGRVRSLYPTDIYAIDGNIKGIKGVELGRLGIEDRASIMMKFDDGRVGIIETNWLTPHKIRKLDIVGFDRVAYLDYTGQTISIHGREMVEEIKFVKEEPLMRELTHFIDVVKNDEKELVTGEDGVQALRVALAARESYKTGNVIKLGPTIL